MKPVMRLVSAKDGVTPMNLDILKALNPEENEYGRNQRQEEDI